MVRCVQCAGERTVIRYVTNVANIGNETFKVGDPANSSLAEYDPCHGHYHLKEYNKYQVFKAKDTKEKKPIKTGGKEGMCVLDGVQYDPFDENVYGVPREPAQFRDCSNQGIGVGRSDEYANHIACQFVDITDLPAGLNYVLRYEPTYTPSQDMSP